MNQPSGRGHLLTELNNPRSANLDQLTALEFVDLCNQEDHHTLTAIAQARQELATAIEMTAIALQQGGKLFYVGAGTSGRLGVLDAAECPPTFCTPVDLVQGIIAGGEVALVRSSEALEDDYQGGIKALEKQKITSQDVVVGISAGGTTPFVHGALQKARQQLAKTVFIACVPAEQVPVNVDVDIRLLTGPEILAGSTRLKAGTATKMALNILSTGVMVKLGKVYGNRMIDVAVTNSKLQDRGVRILQDLTGITQAEAEKYLEKSHKSVKLALLLQATNLDPVAGQELLIQHQGNLRQALQTYFKYHV